MIIIVMGVSGSGKSTYASQLAEALDLPLVEGDDYHPQANLDKMAAGTPLTDADRWPWLEALNEVLAQAELNAVKAEGTGGCVLACSALREVYREVLGRGLSAKPVFVMLEGSRELLLERLQHRQRHFFPPALLESQLATLETPAEAIRINISDPVELGVAQVLQALKTREQEAARK